MSCTQSILSQDILPFDADMWGRGVRRQSLVHGAFVDFCSSDWFMSAMALTCFYNENTCFVLLPCPCLEPHEPVKDYCKSSAACLIWSLISCSWPSLTVTSLFHFAAHAWVKAEGLRSKQDFYSVPIILPSLWPRVSLCHFILKNTYSSFIT